MAENTEQRRFGLFSTITMVLGIVIGSGIFFKSDNVITATNGSILLGLLAFCIAGLSIVFGCLSISELATRTDKIGGVIAYADVFVNKQFSSIIGWMNLLIYFPAVISTVTYVCGTFACQLFGIIPSLEHCYLVGGCFFLGLLLFNLFPNFGGRFQSFSTIVKFIPLLLFAIAGFVFGNPSEIHLSDFSTACHSTFWLAAVSPIAFAFDGWIVATTITHEIKNPKKNIPLAFTLAPLIVLLAYITYFIGICIYLGTDTIIANGNAHLNIAAEKLLGSSGAKIILTFIIASVLGTLNGNLMGSLRAPEALAIRHVFPAEKRFKTPKNMCASKASFVLVFCLAVIFSLAHYFLKKFEFIPLSFDFSEFAIATCFLFYIVLYIQVIKLKKSKQIKSFFKGYICPVLAIAGALIMVTGGVLTGLASPVCFVGFLGVAFIVIITAVLFANKKSALSE